MKLINRFNSNNQLELILSTALLAVLITVGALVLMLFFQAYKSETSTIASSFAVGIACMYAGWHSKIRTFLSFLVGYFYMWMILITLNSETLMVAFKYSPQAVATLIIIAPLPLGILGIVGTFAGRVLKLLFLKAYSR